MQAAVSATRKRPVNLTLNEELVAQAKTYTDNLSATMESLLTEFVAAQRQAQSNKRREALSCVQEWNQFHEVHGSFADEHTTL